MSVELEKSDRLNLGTGLFKIGLFEVFLEITRVKTRRSIAFD